MERGARKPEQAFGLRLRAKTGAKEASTDQQVSIVGGMVTEKVSAVVLAPGSPTEIPVLNKA